jgi:hypothetical protein
VIRHTVAHIGRPGFATAAESTPADISAAWIASINHLISCGSP